MLERWVLATETKRQARKPFPLVVVSGRGELNRGAGHARNACIAQSTGKVLVIQVREYLCFVFISLVEAVGHCRERPSGDQTETSSFVRTPMMR